MSFDESIMQIRGAKTINFLGSLQKRNLRRANKAITNRMWLTGYFVHVFVTNIQCSNIAAVQQILREIVKRSGEIFM